MCNFTILSKCYRHTYIRKDIIIPDNDFCSVYLGDFGLWPMHDGAAFGGNLARVPPGYDETDISSQQGHSGRRDVSSGRERRQKKRESPTLGERHHLRVSDESYVEDNEEADSLNEGER